MCKDVRELRRELDAKRGEMAELSAALEEERQVGSQLHEEADYYGIAVGLLWNCCGIARVLPLGLLWYCCEIPVRLLCDSCDIAMGLLWDCCGIVV